MEYWQFVCYMEGYRQRQILNQIDYVINAVRIGQYTGQYWTGKRAPDANKIINMLQAELDKKVTADEEEMSDEDKIKKLKENLSRFD